MEKDLIIAGAISFLVADLHYELTNAHREALFTIVTNLLDFNKGTYLVGNVGAGKTLLMKAVESSMRHLKHSKRFTFVSLANLSKQVEEEGAGVLELYAKGSYCFDDIGIEREVLYMGNRIKVWSELCMLRDANDAKPTLATSNLGFTKLSYDERVKSRMMGAMIAHKLITKDYRNEK